MHLGFLFFFFNDTATTEIYTLSLHDALPILPPPSFRSKTPSRPSIPRSPNRREKNRTGSSFWRAIETFASIPSDRKSTRLNSSHVRISYAVFCLKKKSSVLATTYV